MSRAFCILHIVSFFLIAMPAFAGVGKISSPDVEKGEWEIEYAGSRTGNDAGGRLNNAQSHALEMEYGLTERVLIGLGYSAGRASPDGFHSRASDVELQYETTRQASGWWLSSALKGDYAFALHSGEPDVGQAILLLQRTEGPVKITANIKLEREVGDNRAASASLSSNSQAIYALNPYFSPGIEWHADYGSVNHLRANDREAQYVGPIIIGTLDKVGAGEINYLGGYYRGLTNASADQALRLQVEYQLRF